MSRVILAMLAMTGRVTMLGLARWAGKGGTLCDYNDETVRPHNLVSRA
jgi:hypothetical protein